MATLAKSASIREAWHRPLTARDDPEQLAAQLALYENIVEHLADAVVINVGDKRVFVNQAYLKLHGLTDKAEALGRPGAFIFCGNGDSAGLHHPAYNFNDEAIVYGTSYWIKLVENTLAA